MSLKTPLDKTHRYLVSAIRKIFRWSVMRRECLRSAKLCYVCKRKSIEYQVDHIVPVGAIPRGWIGWDGYLSRMFTGKLGAICKACHTVKTRRERAERKQKGG